MTEDIVKDDSEPVVVKHKRLKRNLSNRHVQLIAISGAIGTRPVHGIGQDDQCGGPLDHSGLYGDRVFPVFRDAGDGGVVALEPELPFFFGFYI